LFAFSLVYEKNALAVLYSRDFFPLKAQDRSPKIPGVRKGKNEKQKHKENSVFPIVVHSSPLDATKVAGNATISSHSPVRSKNSR
jgi:hypothetical protein